MSERIHDDEPDTSEATVRTLLAAERADWADLPMEYVRSSGTDNAMWRLRQENQNAGAARSSRWCARSSGGSTIRGGTLRTTSTSRQ